MPLCPCRTAGLLDRPCNSTTWHRDSARQPHEHNHPESACMPLSPAQQCAAGQHLPQHKNTRLLPTAAPPTLHPQHNPRHAAAVLHTRWLPMPGCCSAVRRPAGATAARANCCCQWQITPPCFQALHVWYCAAIHACRDTAGQALRLPHAVAALSCCSRRTSSLHPPPGGCPQRCWCPCQQPAVQQHTAAGQQSNFVLSSNNRARVSS